MCDRRLAPGREIPPRTPREWKERTHRQYALRDKKRKIDRGLSEKNRVLGEIDRVLGEIDRVLGEIDRVLGEIDRGLGEIDRGLGKIDRGLGEKKKVKWIEWMNGLKALEGIVDWLTIRSHHLTRFSLRSRDGKTAT